jgi:hypothetical protein
MGFSTNPESFSCTFLFLLRILRIVCSCFAWRSLPPRRVCSSGCSCFLRLPLLARVATLSESIRTVRESVPAVPKSMATPPIDVKSVNQRYPAGYQLILGARDASRTGGNSFPCGRIMRTESRSATSDCCGPPVGQRSSAPKYSIWGAKPSGATNYSDFTSARRCFLGACRHFIGIDSDGAGIGPSRAEIDGHAAN